MRLPYGKGFLEVELPAQADVIEPTHVPGLADERGALTNALGTLNPDRPWRNGSAAATLSE